MLGKCDWCGQNDLLGWESVIICKECALKYVESQTTAVQQLKAEIAALAKRLYTFMDDLDYSGKELSDILAKMRQLSAI
jgi:hypothetical protein